MATYYLYTCTSIIAGTMRVRERNEHSRWNQNTEEQESKIAISPVTLCQTIKPEGKRALLVYLTAHFLGPYRAARFGLDKIYGRISH